MRSEEQYLTDIVEAADAIARFIAGVNRQQFLEDELRQSAVIQKVGVIGEAAGKISPELRGRYPEEVTRPTTHRHIAAKHVPASGGACFLLSLWQTQHKQKTRQV